MIALFFDTETTGFPSETNPVEIIQIGAILQDTESMQILGELNMLVHTTKPSHPGAFKAHGISQELSMKHGVEKRIADGMFALFAGQADVIVAHNMDFDFPVLKQAWQVSGPIVETKERYCTMKGEATDIVGIQKSHGGGSKWPSLQDCHQFFFQKNFEGAHDAMVDVRACRDVYFALMAYKAGLPA